MISFLKLSRYCLLPVFATHVFFVNTSYACYQEEFESLSAVILDNLTQAEELSNFLIRRGDLGNNYDRVLALVNDLESLTNQFLGSTQPGSLSLPGLVDLSVDLKNELHQLRYASSDTKLTNQNNEIVALPSDFNALLPDVTYSVPSTSNSYTSVVFSKALVELLSVKKSNNSFADYMNKALKTSLPRGFVAFASSGNGLKRFQGEPVHLQNGDKIQIVEVVVTAKAYGTNRLFGYMIGSTLRLFMHAQSDKHAGPSWVNPIKEAAKFDFSSIAN